MTYCAIRLVPIELDRLKMTPIGIMLKESHNESSRLLDFDTCKMKPSMVDVYISVEESTRKFKKMVREAHLHPKRTLSSDSSPKLKHKD
jgi:hypothetical protein